MVKTLDRLTPEQRHKNMKNIKSSDTKIEITLRKALWKKGYRYRKNYKKLPGKPDIAITKYKIAIFCDSEFFHGKDGGYVIVKDDGEVLAYHIYNRDAFEGYLLKNTKFERGSTGKHGFATLYRENDKMYINLNLQVRFI